MVGKMLNSTPPLYALRAFEAAARTGSFTRAAEELSITQSAISKHITNLEETLECKLFTRNGPRIKLTELGKNLSLELSEGFRTIENACFIIKQESNVIRIKAPTSLTSRWLLKTLKKYQKETSEEEIHLQSVWMDIDSIDFQFEPYECAILLGNGDFGKDLLTIKLLDEWLIPIYSTKTTDYVEPSVNGLLNASIIHPSPDKRDWKRWVEKLNYPEEIGLRRGLIFDTLDQGVMAAIQGHGVSIGDLNMVESEIRIGSLMLPIKTAIHTGDSYYLVWPKGALQETRIRCLGNYLAKNAPRINDLDINFVS